eukprot:maker-scaffold452_size166894-snap-gene-0.30 protein:Tk11706 transcript:maker-scaffold452_size166894-snap-gene-0.30-mRNA-1 annotation:"methylmalonic aciduria and homocystinuria type d mitochondrial"
MSRLVASVSTSSSSAKVLLQTRASLASLRHALLASSFPSRGLSTSSTRLKGQWRNDTPEGGLTEILVYTPDSEVPPTLWPDQSLGVFAQIDQRFAFPGHVGVDPSLHSASEPIPVGGSSHAHRSDLVARPTHQENQSQVLHSASDFIQHTPGAEQYVCADILDAFPELRGMQRLVCEAHEAPTLLKKEVQPLFPELNIMHQNLSVLTLSQKTLADMSVWSNEMEEERDRLVEQFFAAAQEIVARLKSDGYWADFLDPNSGTPYYGAHPSTSMFETDEKYRLLGFRIEDLGCCKVICHRDFGRHVFVGTIFTNAHISTGIIEDLFTELKLTLTNPNKAEEQD